MDSIANYLGCVKDIEELKQRTKLKKKLEQKTQQEYIRLRILLKVKRKNE